MQRNAPLPISNTGSLHVFPLVVCSSLEPPTLPPFGDRRTNYYRQYERARRESGSEYNGHEDRGFKVHGALVPRVYRCIDATDPPLGSFRVFNWKYRLSLRCRKLRRKNANVRSSIFSLSPSPLLSLFLFSFFLFVFFDRCALEKS